MFYINLPDKSKAFIEHIFEECEKEGFTEYEVLEITEASHTRCQQILKEKRRTTRFSTKNYGAKSS